MNCLDTATTNRKPKRIAPWTAVALLAGSVALAAGEVQPLEEHYQAARAALVMGDTDTAKRELKLSLQDNPLHAESHFLLASLLGREGDLDQAIVGFQRTVTLEPNNAEARYNLGTALLWRREPVSAARLLEDANSIRPDHVPSYNNLALLTEGAGVQKAPGPGDTAKPAVDAGKPKPITLDPPVAAAGRKEKPPVVAEAPPVFDAEREVRNEAGAEALLEILRDLPHVAVEWRGGQLALGSWTSGPAERKRLDRILTVRRDNALPCFQRTRRGIAI